jgi:hypothetical protein
LKRELQGYVDETAAAGCNVRLFWKLGPKLAFAGCNPRFASDAALASASEMLGPDDCSRG